MATTDLLMNTSQYQPASQWVKLREEFVQNLNGTTMEEILYISPLNSIFLFISVFIRFWIFSKLNMDLSPTGHTTFAFHAFTFMLEFLTLVVPVTLQMTVLSDVSTTVIFGTVSLTVIIVLYSVSHVNYDVLYWRIPHFKNRCLTLNVEGSEKLICVTYLRAFVFLMTSISILAVDFHVFPRRFAKTESYGVSLMDMGVGLYVMSNAIVVKGNVASRGFRETLHESLALLSFGVTRCLLMQRVEYQQHVSEYGTHWNFFITLGLVKVMSGVVLKACGGSRSSLVCGITLLLLHQLLLSSSLESFVMSDCKRGDWITANREGIVSLPGYLSLYLIGIWTQTIVCHVDNKTKQPTIKTKFQSMTILIMFGTILFHSLKYLDTIWRVSRRLANVTYVLWTTTVCFLFLILGLAFELVSTCFLPINSKNTRNIYSTLIPEVLKSINNNAFIFFLISNLLTGFINLNFDALNMGTPQSLAILLIYMFTNCAVVYILHIFKVRVKF